MDIKLSGEALSLKELVESFLSHYDDYIGKDYEKMLKDKLKSSDIDVFAEITFAFLGEKNLLDNFHRFLEEEVANEQGEIDEMHQRGLY